MELFPLIKLGRHRMQYPQISSRSYLYLLLILKNFGYRNDRLHCSSDIQVPHYLCISLALWNLLPHCCIHICLLRAHWDLQCKNDLIHWSICKQDYCMLLWVLLRITTPKCTKMRIKLIGSSLLPFLLIKLFKLFKI